MHTYTADICCCGITACLLSHFCLIFIAHLFSFISFSIPQCRRRRSVFGLFIYLFIHLFIQINIVWIHDIYEQLEQSQ